MRAAIEGEAHGCCTSFLVMDDLDTDLLSHIREHGRLSEVEARGLFRQIVSAVVHAHKNRIVLRDLKIDRIFFTDSTRTNVVIADIEGAEMLSANNNEELSLPVFDRQHIVDGCCDDVLDAAALGEILYTMLTGTEPYQLARPTTCLYQKIDGTMHAADALLIPPFVSKGARELIHALVEWDALCSTAVEDILEDAWVRSAEPVTTLYGGSGSGSRDDVGAESPASAMSSRAASPSPNSMPIYGRHRRASISVEIDTDQVVPDACSSNGNGRSAVAEWSCGSGMSSLPRKKSARTGTRRRQRRRCMSAPCPPDQERHNVVRRQLFVRAVNHRARLLHPWDV